MSKDICKTAIKVLTNQLSLDETPENLREEVMVLVDEVKGLDNDSRDFQSRQVAGWNYYETIYPSFESYEVTLSYFEDLGLDREDAHSYLSDAVEDSCFHEARLRVEMYLEGQGGYDSAIDAFYWGEEPEEDDQGEYEEQFQEFMDSVTIDEVACTVTPKDEEEFYSTDPLDYHGVQYAIRDWNEEDSFVPTTYSAWPLPKRVSRS